MEEAEILNTLFVSVFTGKVCPEASQDSLVVESGRDWESDT